MHNLFIVEILQMIVRPIDYLCKSPTILQGIVKNVFRITLINIVINLRLIDWSTSYFFEIAEELDSLILYACLGVVVAALGLRWTGPRILLQLWHFSTFNENWAKQLVFAIIINLDTTQRRVTTPELMLAIVRNFTLRVRDECLTIAADANFCDSAAIFLQVWLHALLQVIFLLQIRCDRWRLTSFRKHFR